jgi:predicted aconitase with swiveling domain/8-oxo-dGTP pyrophosphatase MutT (NUDIX family)
MMMRTKGIGHGRAEGTVVQSQMPISFLGGVDPNKGCVVEEGSDIRGESFAGKILSFPHGKGSTVGSYVIFQLKKSGTAPAAMLNHKAEAIVATGAILAGIPMLSGIPPHILASGDKAIIDADEGTLELPSVVGKVVVTVIAKREGKILILKRSEKVGTYRGHWAGISGSLLPGESASQAASRELREETGGGLMHSLPMVQSEPVYARDGDILWKIHPFLTEVDSDKIKTDWEHDEYRWIAPGELDRYQTVPRLGEVVTSLLKAEAVSARKVC